MLRHFCHQQEKTCISDLSPFLYTLSLPFAQRENQLLQLKRYTSHMEVRVSDHKPVSALFEVQVGNPWSLPPLLCTGPAQFCCIAGKEHRPRRTTRCTAAGYKDFGYAREQKYARRCCGPKSGKTSVWAPCMESGLAVLTSLTMRSFSLAMCNIYVQ